MNLLKSRHAICMAGFIFVSLFMTDSLRADPPELSIQDALEKANSYSPDLKAALARENQVQSRIGVARSTYLPDVDLEAIDSTGFRGGADPKYLGFR